MLKWDLRFVLDNDMTDRKMKASKNVFDVIIDNDNTWFNTVHIYGIKVSINCTL